MSRIGNLPIEVPAGVTVVCKNNIVTVTGPKGNLVQSVDPSITVEISGGKVALSRVMKKSKQKHITVYIEH